MPGGPGSSSEVASSSTRVCGSASTSRASASCWACGSVVAGDRRSRPPCRARSGSCSAHSRASTAASASSSGVRRRVRAGQAQVVLERADEDVVLLRDEGDLAAQLRQLEVDEAHAADVDPPGPRPVDAGHEAAERRLAGAGRPDDGEPLARSQVEGDPAQHVAPGAVGVVHVVDLEVVVGRLLAGGGAVGRHVGDADDAGERGRPDLDLVEPGDELVERACHLLHVERHGGDRADRRDVARDEPAAPAG